MKKYINGLKLAICGIVVIVAAITPSLAFASNYGGQTYSETDMSYLVNTGDAFVIADDGDYFGRINLSTGQVSVIGAVNPPNGENLAIDPTNYVIYNIAGEKTAAPLITIDDVTAATTIINPDTGLYDVDALSFSPVNRSLYAVKSDYHTATNWLPGIMYIVNKLTGNATMVTHLNFPNPDPLASDFDPHIDGMAFHPETGILYGAYSAWAAKSYLVIIDMNTGDMALVGGPPGDPGYTGVDDIEDIAFAPDGTLYGVLGDQGAISNNSSGSFEGLVTLDLATAHATPIGLFGTPIKSTWDIEAISIAVPLKNPPPLETPDAKTGDTRVGIEVMQIDKASLIIPWIAGTAGILLLATGARLLVRRRIKR